MCSQPGGFRVIFIIRILPCLFLFLGRCSLVTLLCVPGTSSVSGSTDRWGHILGNWRRIWGGRRVIADRWPARNRVDLVTQGLNAGPSGEPAPSPSTMGPCERTRALQGRPAGTWAGAPRPPYQGVPASPRSARSGSATLATRATTQVPLTLATALQCCLPARTTVPRTLVPLVPASHVKALPEPDSSPLPACMRAAMGCRQ